MKPSLESAISVYLSQEWNENFLQQAQELKRTASDNAAALEKIFCHRLKFGTAGLRARMGPGFTCMNDLTVLQTSQGFAQYLLTRHGATEAANRGIVIGFDGRHNSHRFAKVVAAAFLSFGFKVYLNGTCTATPMCPFSVLFYSCVAGVQITASHNPKDDNGYKVYAANGAQIIPPMDVEIAAEIERNLIPRKEALDIITKDFCNHVQGGKLLNPYDEIFDKYFAHIGSKIRHLAGGLEDVKSKVVYTAMHGVGFKFIEKMMKLMGLPPDRFSAVPEQRDPDPEFSTVAFPNPEEKGALDLACKLADEQGAKIIIANDPDADRFAAAEKVNGKWYIFKGDEIGILLAYQMFNALRAKGVRASEIEFINSAVSSRMLEALAKKEGAKWEETMTGFKWMMNRAIEREGEGLKIALVYEEALGYAVTTEVPDKDGITAAAVFLQMVRDLNKTGKSVFERLTELREKYGYFVSNNGYYICHDQDKIRQLFDEFRNGKKYKTSVTAPDGTKFDIARIRDVTVGYDSAGTCSFPRTPDSQMVTIFFLNGAVITLRTSGTEPKLKWYSELGGPDAEKAKRELDNVVAACEREICRPHEFPLAKGA